MPSLRRPAEGTGGAVCPEILSDRSPAAATQANASQIGRCAAAAAGLFTRSAPSVSFFRRRGRSIRDQPLERMGEAVPAPIPSRFRLPCPWRYRSKVSNAGRSDAPPTTRWRTSISRRSGPASGDATDDARRGAADRRQHRQAAGAAARGLVIEIAFARLMAGG
jgi:hypothetical protein